MPGTTIGSTITFGVVLGTDGYPSPLTINPAGGIVPPAGGTIGLLATIDSGYVLNQGLVAGAIGVHGSYDVGIGQATPGGTGGDGAVLGAGSLNNQGTIFGGAGGGGLYVSAAVQGAGGNGASGLVLAAAAATNSGTIFGGNGGRGGTIGAIFQLTDGGAGGLGATVITGSLANSGAIFGGNGGGGGSHGDGGTGVAIDRGTLTNDGTISGGTASQLAHGGIGVAVTNASLTNDGTILGGEGGYGLVDLGGGGIGEAGVMLTGGNVVNYGTIFGGKGGRAKFPSPAGPGVSIASGLLTNHGMIIGGYGAIGPFSLGAGGDGIDLQAGSLFNDGTITVGFGGLDPVGVAFSGGGTLTNAGLIAGDGAFAHPDYAVKFGTGASRLILLPGASFTGSVLADASYANILQLSAEPSAGASNGGIGAAGPFSSDTQLAVSLPNGSLGKTGLIAGLGDTITGFGTIQFDAAATWFLEGNQAGLAAGQSILGFVPGDTIQLDNITVTDTNYAGGILTLTDTDGAVSLNLPGNFTAGDFVVTNVASGADITVTCFRDGTRIRTPRGEVPVEALSPGDAVLALAQGGQMAAAAIVWIGYRRVDCLRHRKPELVWPVRIRADTFGRGRPCRDLYLSPDHAIYLHGVLIPVKYLVNGGGIAQVPVAEIGYRHIELAHHAIILAEGLHAESYLDTGDRANFANGGAAVARHPGFASHAREASACGPLVVAGPVVAAVRRRPRSAIAA